MVAALTPTLALLHSCGKEDIQLDEQAKSMLNGARVLVHTHVQLTTDQVNNVHKVVNTPLRRKVIKRKTDQYGEKELSMEHLLGENLGEKNYKAWKSEIITHAEEVA